MAKTQKRCGRNEKVCCIHCVWVFCALMSASPPLAWQSPHALAEKDGALIAFVVLDKTRNGDTDCQIASQGHHNRQVMATGGQWAMHRREMEGFSKEMARSVPRRCNRARPLSYHHPSFLFFFFSSFFFLFFLLFLLPAHLLDRNSVTTVSLWAAATSF